MTALRAEGFSKSYAGREALREVSLTVERGAIHCVVGENGAGKSTMLHLLYGTTRADAGRLWVHGTEINLPSHSPTQAIARGVGLVHQHFMLIDNLSVAENVVLGREPRRGPFVDLSRAEGEIASLARRLGLVIDPRRRIDSLSVGEQQRVEIVKALWRGADVLLLDEPTAVLTPPEVKQLLGVLETLAAEGKSIVLVTHKLEEVAQVATKTTVLRDGRVAGEFPRGGRGHIAEDRHVRGVVLDFSVEDNLLLGRQREYAGPTGIDRARVRRYAEERLAALDVRPPDPTAVMRALSGGNQQKVVVARELSRPDLSLLIAAEPTRGVDIGAAAGIHDAILAAADAGTAVLLVSSELSELRALSDRLVVLYRGRIAAELPVDTGDDHLGRLMMGAAA